MKNVDVEKLRGRVLHDIAYHLGYTDSESLEGYKAEIAKMTPSEAFERWCTWHGLFGYSSMILEAVKQLFGLEEEADAG